MFSLFASLKQKLNGRIVDTGYSKWDHIFADDNIMGYAGLLHFAMITKLVSTN